MDKPERKLTAEEIQSMMIGVCPDCFMGLTKETKLTCPPNAWEIRCIKCGLTTLRLSSSSEDRPDLGINRN